MTAESDTSDGASPWLFLLGLLVFVGSALLFVVDLIRGADVLRSIVSNALGAVALISWAALDTLQSEDSDVATVGGAAGTALLLYSLYLLGTGVIITVTGLLLHERLALGILYLGLSIAAVILGYIIFPTKSITEPDEMEGEQTTADDESSEHDSNKLYVDDVSGSTENGDSDSESRI